MSSDLILVTGASGFVAGYCMLRLLHDGYQVRGTLRSLQRAGEVRKWLTKARGEIDPGDALSFIEVELTNRTAGTLQWKVCATCFTSLRLSALPRHLEHHANVPSIRVT